MASDPFATIMRPTPAELEVARALIARVKAADSSIKRVDELLEHTKSNTETKKVRNCARWLGVVGSAPGALG